MAEKYQSFAQTIESSDLEELYVQQLEKTALGEGESSMGILTILQDYPAKGGWKFEVLPKQPTATRVTVMFHLVL